MRIFLTILLISLISCKPEIDQNYDLLYSDVIQQFVSMKENIASRQYTYRNIDVISAYKQNPFPIPYIAHTIDLDTFLLLKKGSHYPYRKLISKFPQLETWESKPKPIHFTIKNVYFDSIKLDFKKVVPNKYNSVPTSTMFITKPQIHQDSIIFLMASKPGFLFAPNVYVCKGLKGSNKVDVIDPKVW
ncbi:MAG: hypothetical protein ACPGRE_01720 [Flavobacteriaceae bacterium]